MAIADTNEGPAEAIEIRYRPVSELIPYARNSRTHTDEQVNQIAASIREFGFTNPVLIRQDDETGAITIIAGHARAIAAKKIGLAEVPTLDLNYLTETEARAYVIADNRLAELAQWDFGMLAVELEDLREHEFDLELTGFNAEEIDEIERQARTSATPPDGEGGQEGEDDFGEVQDNPIARLGDMWRLGDHWLYCGDSMDSESFDKLLGETKIHCIATDPPYAIYGSATGVASDISDDKMVRPFFEKVLSIGKDRLEWFGHCYMFCDWRSWPSVWEVTKNVPHMEPKNLLMWDKGGAGLGSNYANTYECIAFMAKLPKQTAMGNRASGQRPVHKPNVLRHNRVTGTDRLHNAAKPVALMRELLENSTGPGDHVLEPFTGSGSTIIAADQTERVCFAIEIDPGWVDVTLNRFWKLRGIEPELAGEDGETRLLSEVVTERGT